MYSAYCNNRTNSETLMDFDETQAFFKVQWHSKPEIKQVVLVHFSLLPFLPIIPEHADTVGSSPPSHLLPHKTNPTNHKIPTVNQGIVCKYPTFSPCLSLSPFLHLFTSSLPPSLTSSSGQLLPPPLPYFLLPLLHPFPLLSLTGHAEALSQHRESSLRPPSGIGADAESGQEPQRLTACGGTSRISCELIGCICHVINLRFQQSDWL